MLSELYDMTSIQVVCKGWSHRQVCWVYEILWYWQQCNKNLKHPKPTFSLSPNLKWQTAMSPTYACAHCWSVWLLKKKVISSHKTMTATLCFTVTGTQQAPFCCKVDTHHSPAPCGNKAVIRWYFKFPPSSSDSLKCATVWPTLLQIVFSLPPHYSFWDHMKASEYLIGTIPPQSLSPTTMCISSWLLILFTHFLNRFR